ncbi:MAG: protein phosphatase 2C domain-containing protein [Saprospiraceae bacterium]|nr:protein phosphatase 2C domain-containing protein [Saprospiraceae bacterium]
MINLKKYTITDDVAKKSVEILVVTFDSTARKLDDFKLSEDWKVPALNATGSTAMGEAIKIGLESLQQRKIHLRNNGVNFYKPWLVLITDGAPTDMQKGDTLWKQIQGELKKSSDRICLPWAFGTETADMGNLKDLFPDGHVFRLKDANFESIFKWLSDSVNLVSRSSPGEKLKLRILGIINQLVLKFKLNKMQILHQTCKGKDKPECQDIVRTEIIKVNQHEDLIILCLSDGAGSAESAKEGATLTTNFFIEEIKSYISSKLAIQSISDTNFASDFIIDSTVMRNLIISTRIRVESQIGFNKDSIRDYNCTFASLVYLHNHNENCGYGYSSSIGDSLIIGIQDNFTLIDDQNEDQSFKK